MDLSKNDKFISFKDNTITFLRDIDWSKKDNDLYLIKDGVIVSFKGLILPISYQRSFEELLTQLRNGMIRLDTFKEFSELMGLDLDEKVVKEIFNRDSTLDKADHFKSL